MPLIKMVGIFGKRIKIQNKVMWVSEVLSKQILESKTLHCTLVQFLHVTKLWLVPDEYKHSF